MARRRSDALAAGRGRHGAAGGCRPLLAYVGQHATGQHPAVANQGPHALPLARKHAEERPAPAGPIRAPRRHASPCSAAAAAAAAATSAAAAASTPSTATCADDPPTRTDDTAAAGLWAWSTAAETGESAAPTTPRRPPVRSRPSRAGAGTGAHPNARRQGAGRDRGNASAKRGRAHDRRQPILDPCVLAEPCQREPKRDGQPETDCVAGLASWLRRVQQHRRRRAGHSWIWQEGAGKSGRREGGDQEEALSEMGEDTDGRENIQGCA